VVGETGLLIAVAGQEIAVEPIGEALFEARTGDDAGMRVDFPLDGFGRFGSRLAERAR
jgi:hypothetical protein